MSFKKPGRFVVIAVVYRAHFSCRGESGPKGHSCRWQGRVRRPGAGWREVEGLMKPNQ